MAGKKAMLEDAQRTRRELLRELPIDHSDRRAIEGELEELSAQVAQIEAELPQPVPPPIVDVPTKGQSPAAIPGETGSREADKGPEPRPESREIRKAERTAARDAYKAKCRAAGVKVTDNMIAEAANPKWHSRTQVQKWLVCDPRYDGEADRLIRKVFTEKPHLPKKA